MAAASRSFLKIYIRIIIYNKRSLTQNESFIQYTANLTALLSMSEILFVHSFVRSTEEAGTVLPDTRWYQIRLGYIMLENMVIMPGGSAH